MREEESEKTSNFKVVDRRRFDDDGNERSTEDEKGPTPARQTATTAAKTPEPDAQRTTGDGHREKVSQEFPHSSELDDTLFSGLIISLAQQTTWSLGLESPPNGMSVPKDKAAAKHTIDMLSMLQRKSTGNRSEEESNMLSQILHQLRMAYVAVPD